MTQEKIIHFIDKSGVQLAVHRIPPFATLKDELDYAKIYWADPATELLYKTAFSKLEYLKSNPHFVVMEGLWVINETNKISGILLFSLVETTIMPLIMLDKSIKEIAIELNDVARTTISTSVGRMNEKAHIYFKPSAKKLKAYFNNQIFI